MGANLCTDGTDVKASQTIREARETQETSKEETPRSIYAISDVHTEFYDTAKEIYDKLPMSPATHLVLAGDIGVVLAGVKRQIYKDFLTMCKNKYKNVVLIPGNHEYYGCLGNRGQVEKELETLCNTT